MGSRSKHRGARLPSVQAHPIGRDASITIHGAAQPYIVASLDSKSIGVNASRLEIPRNVYDADFAWIARRRGAVSFFFGKADLNDRSKLRTRVELRYPDETFFHHFWKNSASLYQLLKKRQAKRSPDQEREGLHPEQMIASKDHSEWVNFDVISRAGSHAVFDFYNVSPRGIAFFFAQTGDISQVEVVPVLRVFTTTDELCLLYDACLPIASELEPLVANAEDL